MRSTAAWLQASGLHIGRRSLIYPLLTAATLAIGALREMVVAGHFGLSPDLDAYVAAACLYLFFGTQIGNGLETTFIAKYAHVEISELKQRLRTSQIGFLLILSGLMAVLIAFARPLLASIFGFGADQLDNAFHILVAFFPAILLGAMISLPRAALYIQGSYTLGFSYGGVVSLCVIGAVVTLSHALGILSLPLGYAIGNLIVLAAITRQWRAQTHTVASIGDSLKNNWWHRPFEIWGAATMVLLVEVLFQGSYLTERGVAAQQGEGALAAYFYAVSLLMVFAALVVQPVATILFPKISRLYKIDQHSARTFVLKICGVMFFLGAIAAWLMYELANTLIHLWLVRGKFTVEDGARTAEIFRVLIFVLPFMSISRILKNSLYSRGSYRLPVLTNAMRWMLLAVLAVWLTPLHGIEGLALASILGTIADCILMLLFFLRRT